MAPKPFVRKTNSILYLDSYKGSRRRTPAVAFPPPPWASIRGGLTAVHAASWGQWVFPESQTKFPEVNFVAVGLGFLSLKPS